MTLVIDEMPDSRPFTYEPPGQIYKFLCSGEPDDGIVQSAVISGTPTTLFTQIGVLYRQNISIDPDGYARYIATVSYGANNRQVGSYSWNFDTTGATIKITCAKEHVATYRPTGATGSANPHQGTIGVTQDRKVEGADIIIPAFKLNVTFRFASGCVTLDYARLLAGATGFINSDYFLGFWPGELLFAGATGSDGSEAEAEVGYQFIGSQNASGLTIGNISSIAKNGHDYAWVEFQDGTDGSGSAATPPKCVHVERVYDPIAFAATFGWGGP